MEKIDSNEVQSDTFIKMIVFGGNGFVGQEVVKEALKHNINVVSINRSGAPEDFSIPSGSKGTIDWVKGDLLDVSDTWVTLLKGAKVAISCIGAIGMNHPLMEKVNGEANENAVKECKKAGITKYTYISAVENDNLPEFVLTGYYKGKHRAEKAIVEAFGNQGAILRPGFIYGNRHVKLPSSFPIKSFNLPLWIAGIPFEYLFSMSIFTAIRNALPSTKLLLAPPVSNVAVAKVALAVLLDQIEVKAEDRVMSIDDILREYSHISLSNTI